jgi:hypothetical protein
LELPPWNWGNLTRGLYTHVQRDADLQPLHHKSGKRIQHDRFSILNFEATKAGFFVLDPTF